jgi:hypothetical protein
VPPLSKEAKQALDYGCEKPYGTLVDDCPREEAVGFCVPVQSPISPVTTYVLVNKSTINPDTASLALNGPAICGGAAYDMDGNLLQAKCAGTIQAKVDGTLIEFNKYPLCWFKSDGKKSEYFLSSQNAEQNKSINVSVHEENGKYTVPGTQLSPGVGYLEGNTTFAFPKDMSKVTVDVTQFKAKGAGLTVDFSMGEVANQANGTGATRTITEGKIDIKITY